MIVKQGYGPLKNYTLTSVPEMSTEMPAVTSFERFLNFFGVAPKLKSHIIQNKNKYFGHQEEIQVSDSCYQDVLQLFPFLDILNTVGWAINTNADLNDILKSFPTEKKIIAAYVNKMHSIDTPLTNLTCALMLCVLIEENTKKRNPQLTDKAIAFIEKVTFENDKLSKHMLEQVSELSNSLEVIKKQQLVNKSYEKEIKTNKLSWFTTIWNVITAPFRFISRLFYDNKTETEDIYADTQNESIPKLFTLNDAQRQQIVKFSTEPEQIDELCNELEKLFEVLLAENKNEFHDLNVGWLDLVDNIEAKNATGFKIALNAALYLATSAITTVEHEATEPPVRSNNKAGLFSSWNSKANIQKSEEMKIKELTLHKENVEKLKSSIKPMGT